MSNFIQYANGVINLDQVTRIDVDGSGGYTAYTADGETIVFGTTASDKPSGLLAVVRMTRAIDTEVYDTRNYEEE